MKKLRIALDLDDTIFNWRDCHEKKFNCKINEMTREEIHKQVLQYTFLVQEVPTAVL